MNFKKLVDFGLFKNFSTFFTLLQTSNLFLWFSATHFIFFVLSIFKT